MHSITTSISISIATVLLLGTTAIADPAPAIDKAASAPDNITTGSVYVEPTADQRMADCMAIWDKGTHMTKQQWRRTCKMSLKELSSQ
ncbi:MAG: hypothetical protein ABI457_08620 [Hyphomicrobium sp.]